MRAKAMYALHPLMMVVAGIGVVGLAIVGLFPKLITGEYCKVTIVSIQVDERGQAELVWKGTHSSGTGHYGWASVNGVRREGGGGGGSGGGFPAWPVTCGATTHFSLNRQHEDVDRDTLISRLKVAQGETYMIRPGEPLTFYQYTGTDGTIYAGGEEIP
jgi:hypothetical protein